MDEIFVLFEKALDFFVDLGGKIDFLGMNLWEISFIAFMICCIFRFLFPVIFSGQGATASFLISRADSVDSKTGSPSAYQNAKKQSRQSGGRPIG